MLAGDVMTRKVISVASSATRQIKGPTSTP